MRAAAPTMSTLTLREISRKAGVGTRLILRYERQALIPPRSELSDAPRYTEHDVLCIRFAKRALAMGFTFDEIRELLGVGAETLGEGEDLDGRVQRWVFRIEDRIDLLEQLKTKLVRLVGHPAVETL
jgi:MerR family copper efflux transcriptional regulator